MIKNLTENLKKKKGFTLIELIIVVAIIAILVGLAIPKLMGVQQDSKIKTDVANAKTIANAVATLITQDQIKPNDSGTFDSIMLSGGTPSSGSDEEKVAKYLQTVPQPKAVKDKHFIIKITKETANTSTDANKSNAQDAKIAVIVGTATSDTSPEIYPGDVGNYGK